MPTLRNRLELNEPGEMGVKIKINEVWSGAGTKGMGTNPYMNQGGNGPMMKGKAGMNMGMKPKASMSSKGKMSY